MSEQTQPPPSAPGDTEPGPPPSLPVALWSDSDPPPTPPGATAAFAGLVASSNDRTMPTIGHIGRYALKYQLGEGGLGTVYAAHDPLLSRLIAVKTLNVKVAEHERESFNRLFLDEARAAGGLSHPHIVTVFDAGISDDRAYIAMELLKGRDLAQLRQEGWRATPAQAALIVRRVADALAFAHSKGVIHRDVKPANIFMVGRTQPRVLDFGIARVAHQQEDGDPHTGAGSPYYMAPEQVRRETVDRRADVFSLGVVLYELLTDLKPFRGESLAQIRDAVLHHDAPLASRIDPTVPKPLALIAQRAMAKDPEQRFRSARSFARELRQWIDENPATPDGERAAPAPEPRRQPRVVATIAAAAAAVIVVGGLATWGLLARWSPDGVPVAEARAQSTAGQAATAGDRDGAAATAAGATAAVAAPAPTPAAAASPSIEGPVVATAPSDTLAPANATTATASVGTTAHPAMAAAAPVKATAATNAGGATPAPPSAKETAKDRRAREAREREAREADARVAAANRIVAPATGTVRIAISPWGLVEVDGTSSGAAPPITELTLAEGKHQIVVRNGDYPAYTTQVNVTAGQTVTLRHKFGS
nr:serine/threonine-protein kinase [Caldimonas sp.]